MLPVIDKAMRCVRTGKNISVKSAPDGAKNLVFQKSYVRSNKTIAIPTEHYETTMQDLLASLLDYHAKGGKVGVTMDYFGAKRIEVRSGLMGRRLAYVEIAPRYINELEQRLQNLAHVESNPERNH